MLKFDAEKFVTEGEKAYSLRADIEQIALKVQKEGISNIFFTASGGSNAVMQPFNYWMESKSSIPSYLLTAADFLAVGSKKLNKNSIVILLSKSGDTKETVALAKKMEQLGIRTISIVNKDNTPLAHHSTYAVNTFGYHPQELAFYFLIGKIMQVNNEFNDYEQFADELKSLPGDMNIVAQEVDSKAKEFAEKYQNADYQIWVGSGDLWGTTYSYSMCVLEESQWLRTKSVSSPEFFHGTFELVDKDVPVVLLESEGATRPLDERVANFATKYTNQFTKFDMKEFTLSHISTKFRPIVEPSVMWAALRRISLHLEDIRDHPLTKRRYYRVVDY